VNLYERACGFTIDPPDKGVKEPAGVTGGLRVPAAIAGATPRLNAKTAARAGDVTLTAPGVGGMIPRELILTTRLPFRL